MKYDYHVHYDAVLFLLPDGFRYTERGAGSLTVPLLTVRFRSDAEER